MEAEAGRQTPPVLHSLGDASRWTAALPAPPWPLLEGDFLGREGTVSTCLFTASGGLALLDGRAGPPGVGCVGAALGTSPCGFLWL